MLVRMWRKGNPSILLVGMQAGTATLENSMEVPQKVKNRTTLGRLGGSVGKASVFSSGHDLGVLGLSPTLDSLLLSKPASPSPPCLCSLSLSLSLALR